MSGHQEVLRKFKVFDDKLKRKMLVEATRHGAAQLKQAIERRARSLPVSGKRSYRLADTIVMRTLRHKRDGEVIIAVGPSKRGFWGRFLEFGTKRSGAKPFMRPAIDEVQGRLLDEIAEKLRKAVA